MSKIVTIFVIITIALLLKCYSEKIRYIATERPATTYCNTKHIRYFNLTSRRYGRGDPFYYVGINAYANYEFHNNATVDFYFYEFLSNRYRRGFVEMHFLVCDLIEKDTFFGSAMRQGKFAGKSCPFPAGNYILSNMTIPIKNVPHNFPFTKGRIYANVTSTVTKELLLQAHIDMEIKEVRTDKKNWVDIEN